MTIIDDEMQWQNHFCVDRPTSNGGFQSITIGNILEHRNLTEKPFFMDMHELRKHALIAGLSGSGKTSTCFNILKQLWSKKIPFLVIEPSRTEYRQLMLSSPAFNGSVRVFTLGNEEVAPLRLNPFEIPKGIRIQAHIDALVSIFKASLEMYTPMPQVLNEAICEVYRARGWDLGQNKNLRLPPGINSWDPAAPGTIFPTLNELYDIIEPVTEALGCS